MAHDVVDVGDDDLLQGLPVPAARRYCKVGDDWSVAVPRSHIKWPVWTQQLTPARQLAVPDQSVAAQDLIVTGGDVGDNVSLRVRELTPVGLGRLPLLSILGHNLPELVDVVDNVHVRLLVNSPFTDRRTKVLQASGLRHLIEAACLSVHGGQECANEGG